MARIRLDAKDVLTDLRQGMGDSEIMEKYNLSARGVQSLFGKLVESGLIDKAELENRAASPNRTVDIRSFQFADTVSMAPLSGQKTKVVVDAKEVLGDIADGISDSELMDKYALSVLGLQSLLTKLVAGGLVDQETLDNRGNVEEDTVRLEDWKCPNCHRMQFVEFDICPECGAVVAHASSGADDDNGGTVHQDHQIIELAGATLTLGGDGSWLRIGNLKSTVQRRVLAAIRSLLQAKQRELEGPRRIGGSRLWVRTPGLGTVTSQDRKKQETEWSVKIGRFTMRPSLDRQSLIVEGLNADIQQDIVQAVQSALFGEEGAHRGQ